MDIVEEKVVDVSSNDYECGNPTEYDLRIAFGTDQKDETAENAFDKKIEASLSGNKHTKLDDLLGRAKRHYAMGECTEI